MCGMPCQVASGCQTSNSSGQIFITLCHWCLPGMLPCTVIPSWCPGRTCRCLEGWSRSSRQPAACRCCMRPVCIVPRGRYYLLYSCVGLFCAGRAAGRTRGGRAGAGAGGGACGALEHASAYDVAACECVQHLKQVLT